MEVTRTCAGCGLVKPKASFSKNQYKKGVGTVALQGMRECARVCSRRDSFLYFWFSGALLETGRPLAFAQQKTISPNDYTTVPGAFSPYREVGSDP